MPKEEEEFPKPSPNKTVKVDPLPATEPKEEIQSLEKIYRDIGFHYAELQRLKRLLASINAWSVLFTPLTRKW